MPAPIGQKRRQKILDALAEGLSITGACRAASVGSSTVRDWRDPNSPRFDEDFAKAADEAIEQGTDLLEDYAKERARNGSDVLTIFLLKGRRPTKYRDNAKIEHVGGDGPPIQTEVVLVDTDAVYRGLVDAGVIQPGPSAAADTAE